MLKARIIQNPWGAGLLLWGLKLPLPLVKYDAGALYVKGEGWGEGINKALKPALNSNCGLFWDFINVKK